MGRQAKSLLSDEEIVRRYHAGEKLVSISKAAGVSITYVYARVFRSGAKTEWRGQAKLTPEQIIALYYERKTQHQIAALADAPISYILGILKEAGCKRSNKPGDTGNPNISKKSRRPKIKATLTNAKIVRAYQSGKILKEVAAMAGVPIPYIVRILNEEGIPRRGPGHNILDPNCKRLWPAETEALRADIAAGEMPTLKAIAKKYGITREAVRQHAKIIGQTRYTMKGRSEALRPQRDKAKAERKKAAQQRAEEKAAKKRARAEVIAKLWQAGMPIEAIRKETGGTNIVWLRENYPELFPYRNPAITPERLEADQQRREARRRKEKERLASDALIEELWNKGASEKEMQEATGIRSPLKRAHDLRKKYPERFPKRPRRGRLEANIEQDNLLEKLWNQGASEEEMQRATGLLRPHIRVFYLRKKRPGSFLRRNNRVSSEAQKERDRLLEKLCNEGASVEEMQRATGMRCPEHRIIELRKKYPERFPRRRLEQATKALEARDRLLEKLWNEGASIEEIQRATGMRHPSTRACILRKMYPERFPKRFASRTFVKGQQERDQLLEKLWNEGASDTAMSQAIGLKNARSRIIVLRKRHPERFPKRLSKRTNAISAEQMEIRDKMLEELWTQGARIGEMQRATGLKCPHSRIIELRKKHPERFPKRIGKNNFKQFEERDKLLEKLWNEGATTEEMQRTTGLRKPHHRISILRKQHPERFQKRIPKRPLREEATHTPPATPSPA